MEKPYTNLSSASQPMASNKFGHSQGVSFNRSGNGNSGFQNGGAPVFPRAATTTNSWDNRTNLEMKPNNGRQNFGHMNSGSVSMSLCVQRRNTLIRLFGFLVFGIKFTLSFFPLQRLYDESYDQAQSQNNSYAQNQPTMNPYTQNQGQSNPYYTHDDGRRYQQYKIRKAHYTMTGLCF